MWRLLGYSLSHVKLSPILLEKYSSMQKFWKFDNLSVVATNNGCVPEVATKNS